jgi:hypothetical protein
MSNTRDLHAQGNFGNTTSILIFSFSPRVVSTNSSGCTSTERYRETSEKNSHRIKIPLTTETIFKCNYVYCRKRLQHQQRTYSTRESPHSEILQGFRIGIKAFEIREHPHLAAEEKTKEGAREDLINREGLCGPCLLRTSTTSTWPLKNVLRLLFILSFSHSFHLLFYWCLFSNYNCRRNLLAE